MKIDQKIGRFVACIAIFSIICFFTGCANILGTVDKVVDADGFGSFTQSSGTFSVIYGDYSSSPESSTYFRYFYSEKSGLLNSASKDRRETVTFAWPSTNAPVLNIPQIVMECRRQYCTTNTEQSIYVDTSAMQTNTLPE